MELMTMTYEEHVAEATKTLVRMVEDSGLYSTTFDKAMDLCRISIAASRAERFSHTKWKEDVLAGLEPLLVERGLMQSETREEDRPSVS